MSERDRDRGNQVGRCWICLVPWSSSGAFTNVDTVLKPRGVRLGRQRRANRRRSTGHGLRLNGSTYAKTGNWNRPRASPAGVSSGGLVFGYNNAATVSWPTTSDTSTYYTVYLGLGRHSDQRRQRRIRGGQHQRGRLPLAGVDRVVQHVQRRVGLDGVSQNGQYMAARNTGGKAALYGPSGTLLGSYGTARPLSSTTTGWLSATPPPMTRAQQGTATPAAMAYLDGQSVRPRRPPTPRPG